MKYTVFIKVIDFLKTPNELQKLPVNEKTCRPLNDVHIKDLTILHQSICAVAVADLQTKENTYCGLCSCNYVKRLYQPSACLQLKSPELVVPKGPNGFYSYY